MKTEISKSYNDISAALTSGCYWSGSAESGSIISNVSVFFDQSQTEKFIRGVQGSGTEIVYVITTDDIELPLDLIELLPADIVYVTT